MFILYWWNCTGYAVFWHKDASIEWNKSNGIKFSKVLRKEFKKLLIELLFDSKPSEDMIAVSDNFLYIEIVGIEDNEDDEDDDDDSFDSISRSWLIEEDIWSAICCIVGTIDVLS